VLILLPTRNLAFKLVRRLVALAMRETRGDTVQGKEKFVEQFTNPEVSVKRPNDPPRHAPVLDMPLSSICPWLSLVRDHQSYLPIIDMAG
jgi:hypothetical protein